jgi:hypothetical protein
MCKEFGQFPDPGGMLQQRSRLMYIFEHINAAASERELLDQKKREAAEKRANAGHR